MLELRIPPPVVALLLGAAMWFAPRLGAVMPMPPVVRGALFALLIVGGAAIAMAGSRQFKRADTTVNPLKPEAATALVTSGIYQRTRNPMYLGVALALLGWAVFVGSAWALLGPPLFALYITRFQILPEERALAARFGADYQAYLGRVPRWL